MGLPTKQQHDLACRLLRLEQQLKAYEEIHAEELAELWQALNEWKRELTGILSDQPLMGQPLHKRASDREKVRRRTSKKN